MELEDSNNTRIINTKPRLIERFEVLDVLGEGAAGAVYRVRDKESDGKEVALKVLLSNTAFDENTLDRFMGELKICREIRHPNIVEAYDLIHLGDTIAFTMEYIKGADLGKTFRQKRLSYEEIENYFSKILLGLQALHEHDVVHRDLKLENILIGEDGSVKISDLGLMKWGEFESMTKTGILLGTAQYMPPEYVRESLYDQRGDIYAVGLMLYEVLTGKRRLNDKNGNEALEYLIRTKFELPRITLTGLPPKYLKIIDRATAIDPNMRYQSANEMLAAFSIESLNNSKIIDDSISRQPETRRFCEKSALSQALESSTNRGPNLYRITVLIMIVIIILLSIPHILRWLSPSYSLAIGRYEGRLELYGGTGFTKSMVLDVKPDGIEFSSAFDNCRSGKLDLNSGVIACGSSNLKLKVDRIEGQQISGTIIDVPQKLKHKFSLTKR